MVLDNNEISQMQKDLYSAKGTNISVKEMKLLNNKNQVFDSVRNS